jgi:formylglycine-generating enzyme required for sulfatase activity
VNGGASGRSGVIGVGRLVRGATPNGLFDMSGNVAEWTMTAVSGVGVDVTRFRPGQRSSMLLPMVIRGGSFYDGPSLLTTGARAVADVNTAYDFVGFRVVIVQRISRANGN